MLIYLGAFAEKNAFPDLILVMIFGGLGWVLEKLRWPRPPLILGLVLGGLAESRLFLSMGNYGLSWIWRPMVLVLIAVTLFGALYPVFKGRKEKRRLRMTEVVGSGSGTKVRAKAIIHKWSAGFALGLVIILALALWQSRNFNVRAGLFPWAIGFPLLGLLLLQFVRELMGKAGIRSRGRHVEEEDQGLPADVVNRRTRNMFGWIMIYFLAIWLLGFTVGTTLCCFIQLKFASKEKWLITLIMTAGLWAFVYLLFDRLLHVPFPAGYLLEVLGMAE
jgi:hypothetical protein